MCGIVGVLNFSKYGISWKDKEIFRQMLVADMLRGVDGTGAFIVNEKGDCRTLKIGDTPLALFADKQWKRFEDPYPTFNEKNPKDVFMIGHNRAASVGAISTANSHPFHHDNIVMVHNGTIRDYSRLPKMKETAVDSDALCHAIAELGIDVAISRAYGAYALAFYDEVLQELMLIRNDQRPLALAMDSVHERVYIASEGSMLQWILKRNNITPTSPIAQLKTDTLLTFNMTSMVPQSREVKGPPVYQHSRPYSWMDEVETQHVQPALERAAGNNVVPMLPKEEKRVAKILKKVLNMGISMEVLDSYCNLQRGDPVSFRVGDFIEEDPKKERFILIGTNPTLPRTAIKFRVTGLQELERIMESPNQIAKIKNIVRYPDAPLDDDGYTMWVGDYTTDPSKVTETEDFQQAVLH